MGLCRENIISNQSAMNAGYYSANNGEGEYRY